MRSPIWGFRRGGLQKVLVGIFKIVIVLALCCFPRRLFSGLHLIGGIAQLPEQKGQLIRQFGITLALG
jgi:hypothetical protein